VIQASMAAAVAPVNGNGAKYQSWCRARYARVSNALIFSCFTNLSSIPQSTSAMLMVCEN